MKSLLCFLLLPLLVACSNGENFEEDEIAGTVGESVLLKMEIPGIFPENMSHDDSVRIARKYIRSWIKKELLLEKAEENITEEVLADIEKQLESTRASLLVFNYEQNMIRQRMDTLITETEILAYYDQNSDRFVLKKSIVQALYIKVPLSAPNLDDVRRWYRSDDDADLTELESYCYQFATKYDDFDEQWINFDDLHSKMPVNITDEERFLRNNTTIEASDSMYHYFAHIRDYKLKSNISPVEFVRDQIKSIIYNERKITFISELENNLYNDASTRNEFVIY